MSPGASTPDPPPPRVYYPFLAAFFPVLSLYSRNLGDVRPGDLGLPLLFMAAAAVVAWMCLIVIAPGRHRRGVLLFLVWIPFFAYGATMDGVRKSPGMAAALVAAGLVWAMLFLAAWRARNSYHTFTRVMNRIVLCALLVPLATTILGQIAQKRATPAQAEAASSVLPVGGVDGLPDIYYLIPDSYTRADYLRDAFGFDNTPFLDALRERGFYVAGESRSNYPRTQMSLASSMNLDYLDPALVQEEWEKNLPVFVRQIWDNRLMEMLDRCGYEMPTFSSGVAATEVPGKSGRFVQPRTFLLSEFQRSFFDMTPLRPILHRWMANPYGNRVLFVLEELSRIRRRNGPMFVFVHMMSPHIPHEFDAEGRPYAQPPAYHAGYTAEVECLNAHFLKIIDAVLARQPNSVFILQGDHGPHTDWRDMRSTDTLPWEGSFEDWVRDNTAILNAYYFPGQDYSALYPGITPVNTFRVVLNQFLGGEYPLLPDKSYIAPPGGGPVMEIGGEG